MVGAGSPSLHLFVENSALQARSQCKKESIISADRHFQLKKKNFVKKNPKLQKNQKPIHQTVKKKKSLEICVFLHYQISIWGKESSEC